MRLDTDRTYRYALTVPALWGRLSDVRHFPDWWPWLRSFDGQALRPGEVWCCAVQPPLPYAVRFELRIEEVREPTLVRATASGDIEGTARIDLAATGEDGSQLRLRAALSPCKQSMRAMSWLARPLVTFGHHWVLDTGARQFAPDQSLDT